MLFFATLVVSIFAYIFVAAPTASAADASWKGASIEYDNHQYLALPSTATKNDPTKLPEGSIIYASRSSEGVTPAKSYLIYFAPKTDVTTATTASYIEYDFVPPTTMTNPSNRQSIVIEPQSASNQTTTSCDSRFTFSLGWFICPSINFMSGAMDWLFSVLVGFLTVRPLQSSTDSSLFRAWAMMRSFANVAFVIAFLVLIYSQLTNVGISNYGIKKLLPRLIVAAILVNISYWLCAVAIDISNIVGQSIQDIFIAMRNNIVGPGGNDWEVMNWESVTQLILSGGAAAAGAGIGTVALLTGTIGGAMYLLIPILLSGVLSVLIALLLMAARQAVITVFVILAPLAFVAYLLPNTEKFFEKWRSTFMTMLILFPLFSVVFGGAQLAGIAIIQNANSINVILLGMAVQVVPLAVTPMLIKFGGGLLNRFAGVVNNPNKGFVDRSRKWAQERAGQHKDRVLGNPAAGRLNRASQRLNMAKRRREDWQKVNQANAENALQSDGKYAAIDNARRDSERAKSTIQNRYEEAWNVKAKIDPKSLEQELTLRVSADRASVAKEQLDTAAAEFKMGRQPFVGPMSSSMSRLMNDAQITSERLALDGMRKNQAEQEHKSHVDNVLYKNEKRIDGQSVLDYTTGIGDSEMLQSTTIARVRKEYVEHIGSQSQLMKHLKLSSDQYQTLSTGVDSAGNAVEEVIAVDSEGKAHSFKVANEYVREAALMQQKGAGSFNQKMQIIEASGQRTLADGTTVTGTTHAYRDTVQDIALAMGAAAPFVGDKSLNEILMGNYLGPESSNFHAVREVYEGRIKSELISTSNPAAIKVMFDSYANPTAMGSFKASLKPGAQANFTEKIDKAYQEMRRQAREVLDNPLLRKNVNAEGLDHLKNYGMTREEAAAFDEAERAAEATRTATTRS